MLQKHPSEGQIVNIPRETLFSMRASLISKTNHPLVVIQRNEKQAQQH